MHKNASEIIVCEIAERNLTVFRWGVFQGAFFGAVVSPAVDIEVTPDVVLIPLDEGPLSPGGLQVKMRMYNWRNWL